MIRKIIAILILFFLVSCASNVKNVDFYVGSERSRWWWCEDQCLKTTGTIIDGSLTCLQYRDCFEGPCNKLIGVSFKEHEMKFKNND